MSAREMSIREVFAAHGWRDREGTDADARALAAQGGALFGRRIVVEPDGTIHACTVFEAWALLRARGLVAPDQGAGLEAERLRGGVDATQALGVARQLPSDPRT